MPSTSPRGFGRNAYYATEREYYEAVGEALREEYLAIIDAGLLLQIDDPWLTEILSDPIAATPPSATARAREHVEIVNHSLRGIPTERDPPAHLLRPQPRPAGARHRPWREVAP